jgi:hypothetical protein
MSSQPVRTRTAKYLQLSEFYLALWKQLDLASDEAKWLEIRPETPSEVNDDVRKRLADLGSRLSESELNTARKDFEKASQLVLSGSRSELAELVSFREYLRDLALRYSELADDE